MAKERAHNPHWRDDSPHTAAASAPLASTAATPLPPLQYQILRNPVAPCADAGILHYRGRYYLSGVSLPGKAIVSDDLVHWSSPVHIFTPASDWGTDWGRTAAVQEVHAPCFFHANGKVHLYWNGIGHAVANDPLGPYHEPVPDRPFDDAIDPFLFADEDGRLYFYTVKFDHGNIIYGQPMATPYKLTASPVRLLESTPGTWETRSERVAEGPEVFRHRDRCYMLYAANHTSRSYGTYATGCAVATSPLAFRDAAKYPAPVLEESQARIDDAAGVLLQLGGRGGPAWRYTMEPPPDGWTNAHFPRECEWGEGCGGFGYPARAQSAVNRVNTAWETREIWLRHTLHLDSAPSPHVALKVRMSHHGEVFINGTPALTTTQPVGPRLVPLGGEALRALRPGANIIAAHVHDGDERHRYVDLGLVDTRTHDEDDLVWNLGQPNVVRGPNGFEWFIVYFALWNEGPHRQGINRIFFFDRELWIDGPTGANPPQYQPMPYAPTAAGRFDSPCEEGFGEESGAWHIASGQWSVREGHAEVEPDTFGNVAMALAAAPPATNCLVQCEAMSMPANREPYGLTAWHRDAHNWARLLLCPARHAVRWETCVRGKTRRKETRLPIDFRFDTWHRLRFTNNGGCAEWYVDHVKVAAQSHTTARVLRGAGRVGLVAKGAHAAFDGFVHTVGWDEWDNRITGWRTAPMYGQRRSKSSVVVDKAGLMMKAADGRTAVAKGDAMACYEFHAQVSTDTRVGVLANRATARMGILPVYVNSRNWLAAEFDMARKVLTAHAMRDGRPAGQWEAPLPRRARLQVRSVNGESTEPAGTACAEHCMELALKRPALVDSLDIALTAAAADLPVVVREVRYRRNDGTWATIDGIAPQAKPGDIGISFAPVFTQRLRVSVGTDIADILSIVRTAHAGIEGQRSYNLRAVKLPDRVLLMLDGLQVLEIPGSWPASRPGLTASGMPARFNGITCFQIETLKET